MPLRWRKRPLRFAVESSVAPTDFEFHAASQLEDGSLFAVAWYPVGFDFSNENHSESYSWMSYEEDEGFTLVDE